MPFVFGEGPREGLSRLPVVAFPNPALRPFLVEREDAVLAPVLGPKEVIANLVEGVFFAIFPLLRRRSRPLLLHLSSVAWLFVVRWDLRRNLVSEALRELPAVAVVLLDHMLGVLERGRHVVDVQVANVKVAGSAHP